MNNEIKHYKNKLGLWGWISGGRYGLERYAFTLHRITGLGLLLYFILHIFVTGSRIGGPESWTHIMHTFETQLSKFGEFLVFLAFAFHALNGLRLVITESGYMLGKPQRPVFPYKNAVQRQRPFFVVIMIIAAIIMLFGGIDFYLLGN